MMKTLPIATERHPRERPSSLVEYDFVAIQVCSACSMISEAMLKKCWEQKPSTKHEMNMAFKLIVDPKIMDMMRYVLSVYNIVDHIGTRICLSMLATYSF
jgi:hypothetical protein